MKGQSISDPNDSVLKFIKTPINVKIFYRTNNEKLCN